MKIEHLIVQHLYNNKMVSLEEIGSFFLSSNVSIPESDKEGVIPDNAISFEFNKKAGTDDALINYIVQQTRKIKPLAASDLESYTMLGRQFLNLGKPFHIEGLGTLLKTQDGIYEFKQGHSLSTKMEPIPAQLKEKTEEEIIFTTPARDHGARRKKSMLIIGSLVVIAASMFFILNRSSKEDQLVPVTLNSDTAKVEKESVTLPADTVSSRPLADTGFKVVIREYTDSAKANRAYSRYRSFNFNVVLYTKDSIVYKLAIPYTSSPASLDTSRIKDSLNRFFDAKTYIE
jgi:hypothetical protein